MTTTIEKLQLYRAAARTQRCHNVPSLHQQTVGEHTFGMLTLLRLIYPQASPVLMWTLLEHDVPEGITGDIPSPMLHKFKFLKDGDAQAARDTAVDYDLYIASDRLTKLEYNIYKYCDRMELAIFSLEEVDTGNIKFLRLYNTCIRSIEKDRLTDVTPEALHIYDYVKTYVERWHGDKQEQLDQMFHGTPNK
jgi:5'-deoxynucleotidase YfbR-like HD superfamily hydrolase